MATLGRHVGPSKGLTPFLTTPKTLYRRLLKASAKHPDAFVGEFFTEKYRNRFRKMLLAGIREEEQTFVKLEETRTVDYHHLSQAISGNREGYLWTLEHAYGLRGSRSYELSYPYLMDNILPKPPNPDGLDYHRTPTYSPLLTSLLLSHRTSNTVSDTHSLAYPKDLPPQARPQDPSLITDVFVRPSREQVLRWRAWKLEINRLKPILVIRVIVNQWDERRGIEGKLAKLGLNWNSYKLLPREDMLDSLERGAGKGRTDASNLAPLRSPISTLDLETLPTPSHRRSSFSDRSASYLPPRVSPNPPNSILPGPPAVLPEDVESLYRKVLSGFVCLVLDLRTNPIDPSPNAKSTEGTTSQSQWIHPFGSPWGIGGSEYLRPSTQDDWLWLESVPALNRPEPVTSGGAESKRLEKEERAAFWASLPEEERVKRSAEREKRNLEVKKEKEDAIRAHQLAQETAKRKNQERSEEMKRELEERRVARKERREREARLGTMQGTIVT